MDAFLLVVAGVFFLVAGAMVVMYNTLVAKKNQVNNVFASLDALLKKRHDLIPNLVAAVQEYVSHERGVLEEVTALRTRAMSGGLPPEERAALENQISKHLGQLMVAVENYPDLKANQNFLHLQAGLTEIEEQISAGRRAFNASVTDYNNALEMFPTSLMATMMGYQPKAWFEIDEAERQNVNVKALFNDRKSA